MYSRSRFNGRNAGVSSALTLLVSATFIALLSVGCGGSSGSESEGSSVTVRVGTTNSSSDAPFFIADERGYFEEEGIDVEFVGFDSAARMVAPLGGGQLDVAAGAPSAGLYNAVARDVAFSMVADKGSTPENYGYMPLLVRADLVESGEFEGYGDLEGLTVAEPAEGTATSSTLSEALARGDLGYDSVDHTYLGFPEHVAAFENGSIDASLTTEPSATRAVQSGAAVRFAGTDEMYPDQQLAVVLYSDDFAESDREVAENFMVAYIRAVRDYNDALQEGSLSGPGADEIISIVSEATGIEPDLFGEITPNGVNPDGQLNVESLEQDLRFFEDQNLLEGDVAVNQVVDTSFVDTALEELGPYESGEQGRRDSQREGSSFG